jgi:hypothetical protein
VRFALPVAAVNQKVVVSAVFVAAMFMNIIAAQAVAGRSPAPER